jgi:hypothetical protein
MSPQLSPQDGGFNFANTVGVAVPVVIGGNSGSVIASQNNNVGQSANGGGAVVAGKYRREFDEDDLVARKFTFPTFIDNNGNTVVVGSATGGRKSSRYFPFCSTIVISR